MLRYTLVMERHASPLGKAEFEEAFRATSKQSLFLVKKIINNSPGILVLLKTELSWRDLDVVLDEIAWKLGITVGSITWGWGVAGQDSSKFDLDEKDVDPNYFSIRPQVAAESLFEYGPGGKAILLIQVLGFTTGSYLLGIGILQASAEILMGLFLSILFGIPLLSAVSAVQITQGGITIRYRFRPNMTLSWSEIWCLKVLIARGEWCFLYGNKDIGIFPITDFYHLEEKEVLIKTILYRSSLAYVGPTQQGNIIYRRPVS